MSKLPLPARLTGAAVLTCGAMATSVFGAQSASAATPSSSQPPVLTNVTGMYPVIAKAMSECDLIDLGVQGSCVRTVQENMNLTIHAGLAVDGQYGSATKAAVARYQQTKGLTPDGVVGELTKNAIRRDMQAAADKLDSGAVESGLNSRWVDGLCGMTGPLLPACLYITG